MAYTKQQLKDAFCRAVGFTPTEDTTQNQFLANRKKIADEEVSKTRARLEKELTEMPADGTERMKRLALAQLAKEEAEAQAEDNADVSLI